MLAGVYQTERPIAPKLTEFEAYLQQTLELEEVPGLIAAAEQVESIGAHNMPITVQIPTALRRHTDGVGSVTCAASNLNELFSVLDEKFPQLKPHLRDDQGQIRRFLNVYVNEEDIRFLGGQTYAFQEGDEVLLVPSIAGGAM